MDIQSICEEPTTPAVSYSNVSFWRAEDSGYHTSFTPGSLHCSSSDIENKICFTGQFQVRKSSTPVGRRGIKRSYQDDETSGSPSKVLTPTSIISGGIKQLKVNDSRWSKSPFSSSSVTEWAERSASPEFNLNSIYPSTPVKRSCKTSCNLSPKSWKKSPKKLSFIIHSISCESQALQPAVGSFSYCGGITKRKYWAGQKIDVLKLLSQEIGTKSPPVLKICSYLNRKDATNFKLVCKQWNLIWHDVNCQKKITNDKGLHISADEENKENSSSNITPKPEIRIRLKDVCNTLNVNAVPTIAVSPPSSPRTNKFKKFVKSALLDSRHQISCVRCSQPAKVTRETSGEEWADCTSITCSYKFCKFCYNKRHPGKTCFKYSLDVPSPSKTKSVCVDSKKIRKNLRRLMF